MANSPTAPVALNPVYDWFYARQEVESFFEGKQEVILSFCFFFALDVPDGSGHLLLLYYFAFAVCVCVYLSAMK